MIAVARRARDVKFRLIAAVAVSQVGNWLTFTGLLQFLQTGFGPASVTASFLIQAVLPLLLARRVSAALSSGHTRAAWVLIQLGLAAMSVGLLGRGLGLVYIFALLGLISLLRTVSNTLFMSMATAWTAEEHRQATFTAIGSVGSITLAISPAIGGVIASFLGYSTLFVVDAVSFLVAAAIVMTVRREKDGAWRGGDGAQRVGRWIGRPRGVASRYAPILNLWVTLAVVGAAVNAVEMPVFSDIHHFGVTAFGFALTCYGVGGLAALLLSLWRTVLNPRADLLAMAYATGLGVWMFGGEAGAYVGFTLAGFTYSLLSGQVRAGVSAAAQPPVQVKEMWAWANQSVQTVNLLVYAVGAVLFKLGLPVLGCCAVTLAFAVANAALAIVSRRRQRRVGPEAAGAPDRAGTGDRLRGYGS